MNTTTATPTKSLLEQVTGRYAHYTQGNTVQSNLPTLNSYSICNFRGGVGKTGITFNLALEMADRGSHVLVVDSCPQQNLSEIMLGGQANMIGTNNLYSAFLARITPGGSGIVSNLATSVAATCNAFAGYDVRLLRGSSELYLFPGLFSNQLNFVRSLIGSTAQTETAKLLNSMRSIIDTEKANFPKNTDVPIKTIIDTSPFFAGATHLSWHAVEGLIVPIRVDHQSVFAFELLLQMLTDPSNEFLRNIGIAPTLQQPKIHLVAMTHCGWSRKSEYTPDNTTQFFVGKVLDLIQRYPTLFTTKNPVEHVVLLDDFLSSGRISMEKARPLRSLVPGQSFSLAGHKLHVNPSVTRYKHQLGHLASLL